MAFVNLFCLETFERLSPGKFSNDKQSLCKTNVTHSHKRPTCENARVDNRVVSVSNIVQQRSYAYIIAMPVPRHVYWDAYFNRKPTT